MSNGNVAAMTYEKEHDVIGWQRHDFGGDVESVAVIPQADVDDQLWMIVERTVDGNSVRYVEYMKPYEYQSDTMTDYYFVDCGTVTSVTAAKKITGLGYLEGKELAVIADGNVLNDGYSSDANFVVTDANITIADANQTYSTVYVGLPYTSTVRPTRLEIQNVNGTLSRIKRTVKAHPQFYKTAAAKFSTDDTTWYPVDLTATILYTGEKELNLMGTFSKNVSVSFKQDKPLPMTITGIEFELDVNE
jgi:hypothetical protein